MISKKSIAIAALALACGAIASITQSLAFESYFSKVPLSTVYSGKSIDSQDTAFADKIYLEYSNQEVVPIFIKEGDKEQTFHNLNLAPFTRYSALTNSDIRSIQKSTNWKAFATTTSKSGRQAACIIQYKPTVPYPENGQWMKLNNQRPSDVALLRGSTYHEVEHCMMPRWQLNYAVDYLIEAHGDPGVKDMSIFRNTYALTLSEIFADVYALSNMPKEDTEAKNAVIQYRKIMHDNLLDKGVYAYNWRVIESLAGVIDPKRLPSDSNLRRIELLRLCLERLPLPTPQEIKQRYNL